MTFYKKTHFLSYFGISWSPSVHQTCAHAWELFEMNMGKGISIWSESHVESGNKCVRAHWSGVAARARQSLIKENLKDILSHMLIESHSKVASLKPRPYCNICGEIGHTARSSLHSSTHTQQFNQNNSDEILIQSMLMK